MAICETRVQAMRHELRARIESLASIGRRNDTHALVREIDALRSSAQTAGFAAVACLAGKLETALAADAGHRLLLCYLDALDDAVELDPNLHQMPQALLASVALRVGM